MQRARPTSETSRPSESGLGEATGILQRSPTRMRGGPSSASAFGSFGSPQSSHLGQKSTYWGTTPRAFSVRCTAVSEPREEPGAAELGLLLTNYSFAAPAARLTSSHVSLRGGRSRLGADLGAGPVFAASLLYHP